MVELDKNIVEAFFKELAISEGIDTTYGWKKRFWNQSGAKFGIADVRSIHTWISRGSIPKESASEILNSNISEDLKRICRQCVKHGKVGISFDSHVATGRKLGDIYNYFINLSAELSSNYPFHVSDKVKPIINSIIELKNVLDSKLFDENLDKNSNDLVSIYYGHTNNHKPVFDKPELITSSQNQTLDSLLGMTQEILSSDTDYAESLSANIKSIHKSLSNEKKISDLKARLSAMENSTNREIERLKEQLVADRRKRDRRIDSETNHNPERRKGTDRRTIKKS
jgi:hypothetical protein